MIGKQLYNFLELVGIVRSEDKLHKNIFNLGVVGMFCNKVK